MPNYLYYSLTTLSAHVMNNDADYVIYIKGNELCQWMVPGTLGDE